MAGNKFKPLYNRILFIDKRIRENSYPNANQLAQQYEVSPRTIKRDIEWLRDFHNAPIEYDRQKHGYFYREKGFTLPAFQITEGELFSVALAEKVLSQYKNTPLHEKLQAVFSKIEALLPERIEVESGWLDNQFTMVFEKPPLIDGEIWDSLFAAVRSCTKIIIQYHNPGYEDPLERTVSPYHILCHDGQWYVIGNDSYAEDIRIFAASRISSIKETDEHFTVPDDFELSRYIDSRLGVFVGEGSYMVELFFKPQVASYIKERTWHDKQEIETHADGSITLTFPTSQLMSVLFWVLRWSDNVTVLSPPELVNLVKKSLEDALKQYK